MAVRLAPLLPRGAPQSLLPLLRCRLRRLCRLPLPLERAAGLESGRGQRATSLDASEWQYVSCAARGSSRKRCGRPSRRSRAAKDPQDVVDGMDGLA